MPVESCNSSWLTSQENSKFSLRPKLIVFGTGDSRLLLQYPSVSNLRRRPVLRNGFRMSHRED